MRPGVLALAALACSCATATLPHQPPPATPCSRPEHLVTAELNVVARIDWQRAPGDLRAPILGFAREAGFDDRLLQTVQGCLQEATAVWLGMRVTRKGFEGDAVAIVEVARDQHEVPCGARQWRESKRLHDMAIFEPLSADADRRSPALLARHATGFVVVASNGQLEAVMRVVRAGPDKHRLQPGQEGLVTLEALLAPDTIPDGLEAKVPLAARMAKGLERVWLVVDVEQAVRVRATFAYGEAEQAKGAGELLTRFRTILLNDDKPGWQAAARSAHASVLDDLLKFSFEVPR